MVSLFSNILEDYLEVGQGSERVGRILVVVNTFFKIEQNTRCLDIQLGIRWAWSRRIVGF